MRKIFLIAVLLLPGCYINPSDNVPTPPKPVNPDLQGVALEAYQHAREADTKPGEIASMIVALKLTVSKAGAMSWDTEQINTDYLESNKAIFAGDNTASSRWGDYFQWQGQTLKPITDPKAIIQALKQVIKGLEAVQ